MHCEVLDLPDGTRVTICGANRTLKMPACRFCGKPSVKLCDFPVRDSTGNHIKWYDKRRHTCDAPLCENCTTNAGGDSDLCPVHAKAWKGKAVGV